MAAGHRNLALAAGDARCAMRSKPNFLDPRGRLVAAMRHALSLALARGPNSRWQSTPFPIEPARRGCKCRLQSATFVLKSTPQPARNFCRSAASLPRCLLPSTLRSAVLVFCCLPHTSSALSWLQSSPLDPSILPHPISSLLFLPTPTPLLPHPSLFISASSFLPHSRLPRYHLPRRLWLHRRPLVAIAFAATTTRRLVCLPVRCILPSLASCLSASISIHGQPLTISATTASRRRRVRRVRRDLRPSIRRIASHQPLASRNNLIVLITIQHVPKHRK